jgi:hypothetical protein
VGFVDNSGEELVVKRSRERGLETSMDDIMRKLCLEESPTQALPETLMQTSLIRDETIASLSLDLPEQSRATAVRVAIGGLTGPDHSTRTRAILDAANVAKMEQERKVEQVKRELSHNLTALTEARSVAERQADVAEAELIIRTLAPDLAETSTERAEILRRRVAHAKQSIVVFGEAVSRAEELREERIYFESEIGQTAIANARANADSARQAKERADESLAVAKRLESTVNEGDAFVSHMVALLNHGEALGLQAGHCPLCKAIRNTDEFEAAIAAARSNLSELGKRAAQAKNGLEQARIASEHAGLTLREAEQHLSILETRRSTLLRELEGLASTFSQWSLNASPSKPELARQQILKRQEDTARLEYALFILEASSAHDRVSAFETRVQQLRGQLDEEEAKLNTAERAFQVARQVDHAAKEVANQVLTEQFDTVMPLLTELYQRLRPHTDWSEIETDFGGRVRASLNLTVGDGRNPQFLFSSGQRRAAGIAFLLAIHLSRPWCRMQTLLLDDPVQHIDDYRALNLVEVLSAVRRTGRQVIVSVEDPALADVLCRRLRSTALEGGKRFELITAKNGSAAIARESYIFPMHTDVLQAVEV